MKVVFIMFFYLITFILFFYLPFFRVFIIVVWRNRWRLQDSVTYSYYNQLFWRRHIHFWMIIFQLNLSEYPSKYFLKYRIDCFAITISSQLHTLGFFFPYFSFNLKLFNHNRVISHSCKSFCFVRLDCSVSLLLNETCTHNVCLHYTFFFLFLKLSPFLFKAIDDS